MLMDNSAEPRFNLWVFVISCFALVIVFFKFYPPIYAFRDEGIYFALAQVFKTGTLFIETTGIPVSIYVSRAGHHLPFYPPGNSLLLIPFSWIAPHAVFVMGLCMHITGAVLFRKIAKIFSSDYAITGLLYLFFPSFIFYSRTIMSDIPSLTLFLAAYYCYFRLPPTKGWAAFFFGLSLFFRVSNVIIILPFFLSLCLQSFKRGSWKDCLLFMSILSPFVILMAAYNTYVYGSPLLSGYSEIFTGVKNFSTSFFLKNASHYLITLNVAYPLMLILFAFSHRISRLETNLLFFTLFFFFGFYYFLDRYPQPLMEYVFGNRFLYPIIPFLIMAFANQIQNIIHPLGKRVQQGVVILISLILLSGAIAIHKKHQTYLLAQASDRNFIYANTKMGDTLIYDGNTAELVQKEWGERNYCPYETFQAMQTTFNKFSTSTDIYLALRNISYGSTMSMGTLSKDFNKIQEFYDVQLKATSNNMSLYQIKGRDTSHAIS